MRRTHQRHHFEIILKCYKSFFETNPHKRCVPFPGQRKPWTKWEDNTQNGRKYLQMKELTNNSSPKYTSTSCSSITKTNKQTNKQNPIKKKKCVYVLCAKSLSCAWLFAAPWTVAHQAPLSMRFSRQEYWNGLPFPPLGNLLKPGIEPTSLTPHALSGRFFTTSAILEAPVKKLAALHRYFLKKNADG